MVVAIAGGHGKIALRLTRLLNAAGESVLGLIRNPDHAPDIRAVGGDAVVCDLEGSTASGVSEAIRGADAVVFAAGAGPGSGAERKWTVDRDAALLLIEAAKLAGISRYVMVSSMGADPEHQGEEVFDVYLRAKGEADRALAGAGLEHTIVKPGRLTDEPGKGLVQAGAGVPRGEIPRQDVAAVIAHALREGVAIGAEFELVSGDEPIARALANLG